MAQLVVACSLHARARHGATRRQGPGTCFVHSVHSSASRTQGPRPSDTDHVGCHRTRADLDQARGLYESGLTLAEVSEQVGIAASRLSQHLRRLGVTMRPASPRRRSAANKKIVQLRDSGLAWRQIAGQVGMSVPGARQRYLEAQGIHRQRNQPYRGSTRLTRPAPEARRPRVTDEQVLEIKSWGATNQQAADMLGLARRTIPARLQRSRGQQG